MFASSLYCLVWEVLSVVVFYHYYFSNHHRHLFGPFSEHSLSECLFWPHLFLVKQPTLAMTLLSSGSQHTPLRFSLFVLLMMMMIIVAVDA